MVRMLGSSPLARGLHGLVELRLVVLGIIPARAGFTLVQERSDASRFGSSPLARGLRARSQAAICAIGIIPARAGFTRQGLGPGRGEPDHPRSRGVYMPPRSSTACLRGSSPLARGLQRRRWALRGGPGIIPARAGFTR